MEHRLVKQWVEIKPHWFLARVDAICTEVTFWQAVMVNHNISLIETKIDSDNIQRIFVYYTYNRTQLYTISPSSTVGIQLHVLAETCSCIPTILLGEI